MSIGRYPLKTASLGSYFIAGSFGPDTANPPTLVRGFGFSVVRTSAGLFTVTITEPFVRIKSASATLQLAAADDKYVQVGQISGKTFQIRVYDISGAGVADVAINTDNRINFLVELETI